jgi:hypothetical protein
MAYIMMLICCCCCVCDCVLQTSVVSLGNTKQPLPGFQSRGSLLAARHGELNSNVSLAAGMAEVCGAVGGGVLQVDTFTYNNSGPLYTMIVHYLTGYAVVWVWAYAQHRYCYNPCASHV